MSDFLDYYAIKHKITVFISYFRLTKASLLICLTKLGTRMYLKFKSYGGYNLEISKRN